MDGRRKAGNGAGHGGKRGKKTEWKRKTWSWNGFAWGGRKRERKLTTVVGREQVESE